jgi:hypothetical protein
VVPYVTDQLAMARLPRATFSMMLALLPMFATVIGALVLRQLPAVPELLGIALVIAGVGVHQVPVRGPEVHDGATPNRGPEERIVTPLAEPSGTNLEQRSAIRRGMLGGTQEGTGCNTDDSARLA